MFIILGIFLLFLLGNSLSKQVIDYESVIVQLVFLSISIILYFLFDKAKTVEFDTNYMYVSGKGEEERILLSDVFKIKLTMTKINNRSMWKISYYDVNKAQKSVRVLPRWFYENFNEFKAAVKSANEDVTIKNFSHSFDFDQ